MDSVVTRTAAFQIPATCMKDQNRSNKTENAHGFNTFVKYFVEIISYTKIFTCVYFKTVSSGLYSTSSCLSLIHQ